MNREEWLQTVKKNLVWVELGVFLGDFSKKIYELSNPLELHLVDTFPDVMVSGDKDGNNVIQADLSKAPNDLEKYFVNKNVKIHKMMSFEFLENLPDSSIDVVYIDADHSYNSVKKDLELSMRKVRKSGLITGHDYCPTSFPGVYRAVNEFCNSNSLKIDFLTDDKLPTYVISL